MNKNNIISFIFGTVVGAGVAYIVTKNKYEQILDSEIESVKEYYEARHEERKKVAEEQKKPDLSEYKTVLEENGYVQKEEEINKEEEEEPDMVAYTINEDQFDNENPDYDKITFQYYQNGTLTDDNEDVIEEDKIEEIIGDALNGFEDPSCDVVYVRNDILKGDYEILRILEDF